MARVVALHALCLLGASLCLISGCSAQNCSFDKPGVALGHGSLGSKTVASAAACCAACDAQTGCVAFTFEPVKGGGEYAGGGACFLKDNTAVGKCSQSSCVSGTNGKKPAPHPPGPSPRHHPSGPPGPPTPPAPPQAKMLEDLATLRKRFFDFYLNFGDCTQTQFCMQGSYMLLQDGSLGTCAVTCKDSKSFAASLSSNGTWDDVDYADETHAKWKPMLHPDRLLSMIRSYHCGECGELYQDAELLKKVHLGLGWWFTNKPKPSQWWWADIGQPDVIGAIMMLLNDDATPAELSAANETLVGKGVASGTGENVVWELQVAINRAALTNDTANAWKAFANMWGGTHITTGDGIQMDGSFHFHGNILYSGGYGADYAINLAVFTNLSAGTSYEIPPTVMDVLSMYLLDGQQYMVHSAADAHGNGTYYDISTKGREISRPPHGNLLFPAAVMSSSIRGFPPSSRQEELHAFAQRIAPESKGQGEPMVGGRHFWLSDYTAYHAPSHFSSLKMFSTRMSNNEICNDENLKADHTADGVLYTYQTGQEYLGIFPVWDWSRLPGTTNRAGVLGTKVRQQGPTSFVGGLAAANSSSSVAVSVMDYQSANFGTGDEGGVSARKSWFFLPTGTVALVYNISGVAAPAAEIVTTLEQNLLANPGGDMGGGSTVSIGAGSGAPTVVAAGNSSVPAGHWVHHDGKVYTPIEIPQAAEVAGATTSAAVAATWKLETGVRTGSWTAINGGLDNATDGATVSLPVFLLEASHGPSPTGVNFAYAVLPGVGAASNAGATVGAFEASMKVISNDAATQAVLATPTVGEDVLMIVAWPAAVTTVVDGGKAGLKVTLPGPTEGGLLTVTLGESGAVFSAADPTNNSEGGTLTFTIDKSIEELRATAAGRASELGPIVCKKAATPGSTTVTVALPSGAAAGSTVSGQC